MEKTKRKKVINLIDTKILTTLINGSNLKAEQLRQNKIKNNGTTITKPSR